MILIEFLLAPTVPSPPKPQNLQEIVPAAAVSGAGFSSSERPVTSSTIPIVKLFFGSSCARFSYTAKMLLFYNFDKFTTDLTSSLVKIIAKW